MNPIEKYNNEMTNFRNNIKYYDQMEYDVKFEPTEEIEKELSNYKKRIEN